MFTEEKEEANRAIWLASGYLQVTGQSQLQFDREIREIGVFYTDNKISPNLLHQAGVQYPATGLQSGLLRRIDDSGLPVNMDEIVRHYRNALQLKRFFGDWQNNPQKASKVVDKEGRPLVFPTGVRRSLRGQTYTIDIFTYFTQLT